MIHHTSISKTLKMRLRFSINFCKDKGNKLVFLELYYEEDVAALFINNYRFKILDNAVCIKNRKIKYQYYIVQLQLWILEKH